MEIIIKDVGINMDSLKDENGVILGEGDIYSTDSEDALELEYTDRFTFTYSSLAGVEVECDSIFNDYLPEIKNKLYDNLKTNYLQYK